MLYSIHALISILLVLLLFMFRRALLFMARNLVRCQEILYQNSSLATEEDQSFLPKEITYGKELPAFHAIDVISGHAIDQESLVGQSSIIVFFRGHEYERCPTESLKVFFQSWWYHIDGKIYVILLNSKRFTAKRVPHSSFLNSEIGQSIVLGTAVERDIARKLGLTKTPCVIELSTRGTVRKIGFFEDEDWNRG